jgi:hypothetical protein
MFLSAFDKASEIDDTPGHKRDNASWRWDTAGSASACDHPHPAGALTDLSPNCPLAEFKSESAAATRA